MLKKATIPAAIVFLIIIILLIPKGISIYKIKNLEKNLVDINIEKITFENQDYKIKNGQVYKEQKKLNLFTKSNQNEKILALANFYILNLENPILTINHSSIEDFQKATNLLSDVQNNFIYEKILDQEIYPISFLENVAKTTTSFEEFKNNVSDTNSKKLSTNIKKTNQLYIDNLTKLKSYYVYAASSQNNPRYVALNTSTSARIIKNDLDKFKKNTESVNKEIQLRESCLNAAVCPSRKSSIDTQVPEFLDSNQPTTLDTKELVTSQYAESEKKGPYLIKTPCFGDIELKINYPFYVFYSINGLETEEYKTFVIKRSDEVYFRKLNEVDPLDKIEIEKGIKWTWFGESNQYACNNLTYQTKIATMAYFQDNFKEPILEKIKDVNDKIKELSEFENKFYNSSVKSEENFDNLAEVYKQAYEILKKEKVTSTQVPQKTLILERYLTISRNLGYFERLVNQATYTLQTNLIRDKKLLNENTVNHGYFLDAFLTSRIQYSLLYFPFTKSFWLSTDKLNFLENEKITTVDNNQVYITLGKAKESYSEKEIKSWYISVLEQVKSIYKPRN